MVWCLGEAHFATPGWHHGTRRVPLTHYVLYRHHFRGVSILLKFHVEHTYVVTNHPPPPLMTPLSRQWSIYDSHLKHRIERLENDDDLVLKSRRIFWMTGQRRSVQSWTESFFLIPPFHLAQWSTSSEWVSESHPRWLERCLRHHITELSRSGSYTY